MILESRLRSKNSVGCSGKDTAAYDPRNSGHRWLPRVSKYTLQLFLSVWHNVRFLYVISTSHRELRCWALQQEQHVPLLVQDIREATQSTQPTAAIKWMKATMHAECDTWQRDDYAVGLHTHVTSLRLITLRGRDAGQLATH